MNRQFAAVVPVYNPEPGLRDLVDGLLREFSSVVVVDDGSVEEKSEFAKQPDGVVVLRHEVNRGKGRAMKTAIAWIRENRPETAGVVFADGDGQHRLEDVVLVADKSAAEDAVVFGVRDFSAKAVPFRSWWGNRWTAIEVRLLFGFRIGDTQTGLRAVPKRLFGELLELGGERFEYEAGWFRMLHGLRERLLQVPIATVYRDSNRASHFRPLRDTMLTQRALFVRN